MTRAALFERFCAVTAFAAPLALFLASTYPGIEFADPGELQTVAAILGIAHPTGFPAFTLLGWIFAHALPGGDEAWRVSAMCALAMAAACGYLFLCARELGVSPASACGAALVFAAGSTAWTAASHADVQALGMLFAALLVWLALRWRGSGDLRFLAVAALLAGVAASNHPLAIFLIPGLLVIVANRRAGLRIGHVAVALLLIAAGLSLYAYLPIRSAIVTLERSDRTLLLGFPPGMAFWDYNHPSSAAGFLRDVSGADFGPGSTIGAYLTPAPYLRLRDAYLPRLLGDFGPVVLALAAAGWTILWRRGALLAGGLLVTGLLPAIFGLGYLAEQDFERYFLSSFWIVALGASAGMDGVAIVLLRGRRRLQAAVALLVLCGAAIAIAASHRAILAHHDDDSGRRFIAYMRARTPENAIVVASWAYAPPLAYAAYVEHSFGDRIVVSGWPEEWEPAYRYWVRARPIYAVSNQPIALRSSPTRLVDRGSGPILVQVDP